MKDKLLLGKGIIEDILNYDSKTKLTIFRFKENSGKDETIRLIYKGIILEDSVGSNVELFEKKDKESLTGTRLQIYDLNNHIWYF